MISPVVTRGYLFSVPLVVAAGYEVQVVAKTSTAPAGGGWRRIRGTYTPYTPEAPVVAPRKVGTGIAVSRCLAFGSGRVVRVPRDVGTVFAAVECEAQFRIIESKARLRQRREDEELLLLDAA